MERNLRAHELSHGKFTPEPSTLCPKPYDPREHRRQMHKECTALMLELQQSATTLRSPSLHFSCLDASLIRKAQKEMVLTPPSTHTIPRNSPDDPPDHIARAIPVTHTLWNCPAAQSSLHRILASITPRDSPRRWSDWTAPSKALELTPCHAYVIIESKDREGVLTQLACGLILASVTH